MASHPVRIGLKLAPHNTTVERLRGVWQVADEGGFDHVWDFDHFAPIFSDVKGPVFDGWMLLGAMAEATKRVRIGCMVTGNTYRHPVVLAKMAVTVDHLSGGRLEFGIGAAWAEVEHQMLGLEFPGVGERIRRLGEACEVVKRLWTESPANFQGRYYTLTNAYCNPPPIQKPHPPIWIGGSGERKTLRVVAEHADVWNIAGGPVEEAKRLSGVLDQHCEAVGRDPAEIRRSVQYRLDPKDVKGTLRGLDRFVAAGFSELIVNLSGADAVRNAELAAQEILPRFRD